MIPTAARDALLDETRRAFLRAAELEGAPGAPHDSPVPGDVFVVDLPGELTVEWVVLAFDPIRDRVLLVPADGRQLVGSGDVAALSGAAGGPLTLRCRLAEWLDAGTLEPGMRTSSVDAEVVARALRKCAALRGETRRDGIRHGSVLAREVDESTEYQDWLGQVVEPMRRELLAKARQKPIPAAAEGRRRTQLAASIVLAVLSGLAAGLFWQRHAAEAPRDDAVLNPVVAILETSGTTRGQPQRLSIPSRASHVLFFVPLTQPFASTYQIMLAEARTGREVWRSGQLTVEEPAELRLGLPASLLAGGEFTLRVAGFEDGQLRPRSEITLLIDVEGSLKK